MHKPDKETVSAMSGRSTTCDILVRGGELICELYRSQPPGGNGIVLISVIYYEAIKFIFYCKKSDTAHSFTELMLAQIASWLS